MVRELAEAARAAALEAGAIIRDSIGKMTASQVHMKGVSDYVTEVDMQCEGVIMEYLQRRFPRHHIMSEETPNEGMKEGITWVIDPLDGTANFIHGFPFVAVSIAACEDGLPVAGVVLDPIREEVFSATRGGGAHLNGRPIRIRSQVKLQDTFVATGFPHRTRQWIDPYLAAFREIFLKTGGIRRAGAAALDLAYLAAGRVDGFWEMGLKPWDVAAGSLLVLEAGGIVTDFWGGQEHLTNGHIVGGNAMVHPFLLEIVRGTLAPALEPPGKGTA